MYYLPISIHYCDFPARVFCFYNIIDAFQHITIKNGRMGESEDLGVVA